MVGVLYIMLKMPTFIIHSLFFILTTFTCFGVNANLLENAKDLKKNGITIDTTFDKNTKCYSVSITCNQKQKLDLSNKDFTGFFFIRDDSKEYEPYELLASDNTQIPIGYKKLDKLVTFTKNLIIAQKDINQSLILLTYYRAQTCPESIYITGKLIADQTKVASKQKM